jgi:hypothetical protein
MKNAAAIINASQMSFILGEIVLMMLITIWQQHLIG